MKKIFVIDNGGVTDGPFATSELAREQVKENYKSGFKYKGNVRIVEVLEELDNAIYNGGFDNEIRQDIS